MLEQLTGPQALKFISQIEAPFKGLPHLPKGVVNFLVNIAPWFAALGGVFSIIAALSSFGAATGYQSSVWMQLAGINTAYFWLTGVVELIVGVLMLMAFNPLKEKLLKGWIYMFWIEVIDVAQMLIGVAFGGSNVVSMVIGLLIGLYFLFELKSSYKA